MFRKSLFLLLMLASLVTYARGFDPMPEALAAMSTDSWVDVSEILGGDGVRDKTFFLFSPRRTSKNCGFIFYPGAKVDARSYAPLMKSLAYRGHTVALVNMPVNQPLLGMDHSRNVIKRVPQISNWVIGGHSLGGVSAAAYAKYNSEKIKGLVLWASYTSPIFDLSDFKPPVLSVYGSQDGLTTIEDINRHKPYLPIDTDYQLIHGANHTGFGSYGDGKPQAGDQWATISRDEQQKRIVEKTNQFLRSLCHR